MSKSPLDLLLDAYETIRNAPSPKAQPIAVSFKNYKRAELMIEKGFVKYLSGDFDIVYHWQKFIEKYPEYKEHLK